MENRIQQLEAQVTKLTNKITQLEQINTVIENKFTNVKKDFDTMAENLTILNNRQTSYDKIVEKLTENISKLSDTVINNIKFTKSPKQSSPYEKTSYEQTKKAYNLHSNKQKCAFAEDSDTTPATDNDMSFHDQDILTDNATYDGVIGPDSNSGQINNNASTSSTFGSYNIFGGFGTRK